MQSLFDPLILEYLKTMNKNQIAVLWAACFISASAMAENTVTNQRTLSERAAESVARAALSECQNQGYQVTVAVVDRGGVPLVLLRDNLAGAHTPSIAINKAWTAANFRTSTSALVEISEPGKPAAAIRNLPNVAVLGGGLTIKAKTEVIGAIGVSGAPGGHLDEACSLVGIKAIQASLDKE